MPPDAASLAANQLDHGHVPILESSTSRQGARMARLRMFVTALTVMVLAVTAGVAGASAASADGPKTSRRIQAKVEALPWPTLKEGDARWEVGTAGWLMTAYKYLDLPEVEDTFHPSLTRAVQAYQKDRDLSENGRIGPETWEHIRSDFGTVRPSTKYSPKTRAFQYALYSRGYKVEPDGYFGANTTKAVKEFQKKVGIDADGQVGPITFRALICGGA
ncbi:peptidoglycan-binding domain-containing protein [Actinomadura kijaniata]|uniref:peptidoglycan-binding domain-containing protein n=1 Tax=Actinomadura kijaniata TaxID=46161 RepID=UPI003F1A990E